MEELLSREQIDNISNIVLNNPQFRNPYAIMFGLGVDDINKVSPINGLILINGNLHTGFDHILDRHNYWSLTPYWKDDITLQDQGRFRKDFMPIIDIILISDVIYDEKNIDIEKNNRPEIFDVYTGEYTHQDGSVEKYRLILYKDSKIIHTLFPIRTKHNMKRTNLFSRGDVKGTFNLGITVQNTAEAFVPYMDKSGNLAYLLTIRRKIVDGISEYDFVKYDNLGNGQTFSINNSNINIDKYWDNKKSFLPHDMNHWLYYIQFSSLRDLEKKMGI